jgi:hypothetical protein
MSFIVNIWRKNPLLVILIAFLIVGPALGYGVYAGVQARTAHTEQVRLESLLQQARDAKLRGDIGRALQLITQIEKADPTFKPVAVAQVAAGLTQANGEAAGISPGASQGATPVPGSSSKNPVYSGELTGLFPKSLDGYALINDSPGSLSASRLYKADRQAHPKVALLTVQFTRAGSDAAVAAYIAKNIKGYYGVGGKTLEVKGLPAYFGSDGGELAILAYPSSGIVVELEMSVATGSPGDLYDDLVALSKIIP